MKSYLKTQATEIDSIGETLTLRALSAGARSAFMESEGSMADRLAIICQAGVMEWAEEKTEDIASNLSTDMINEISEKIFELSGVDLSGDEEDSKN